MTTPVAIIILVFIGRGILIEAKNIYQEPNTRVIWTYIDTLITIMSGVLFLIMLPLLTINELLIMIVLCFLSHYLGVLLMKVVKHDFDNN